jgi:GAF domain/FHA domain
MPARLTLYLADRPARVLSLRDEAEYVIGRDPASDVFVDDERVSRRHARLLCGPAGWELGDLGSKNGTYVNSVPAHAGTLLGDQGWLLLGGVLAAFERLSEQQSRREAEAQIERWRSTLASRRRLAVADSLDSLVRGLLDSVVELCGAERGFVLLARADGELEVAAASGFAADDLRAGEFSGSIGAVERALASGSPVAASDALADPLLGGRESIARNGIRALVCVPVAALDRPLGAIYADSRAPRSAFTELDVEILEALASQAALAIAAVRLDEEVGRVLADLQERLDLPAPARALVQRELEQARRRWRIGAGGGGIAAAGGLGVESVSPRGARTEPTPAAAGAAARAVTVTTVDSLPGVPPGPPVAPGPPIVPGPSILPGSPIEPGPSIGAGPPVAPGPPIEPGPPLAPGPPVAPGSPMVPSGGRPLLWRELRAAHGSAPGAPS